MSYKPLKKFPVVSPFIYLPLHPKTTRKAWKYIWTILKDFFFLQIGHCLHITKHSVIYVDTAIDNRLPFTPSYVDSYIGFVAFFVRPISMIMKKLGFKKAYPYINEYLQFLSDIYHNASTIYRQCMTTTVRPKYLKNSAFIAIHLFDPHKLCVPSIHVALGTGVYQWCKHFFEKGLFPAEEAEFRLEEIKNQGIDIIESVLFVKQHSINCIPMALYMLTATNEEGFFTSDDAHSLIQELFKDAPEITGVDKILIRQHFCTLYDDALAANLTNEKWQDSIINWLIKHAKETNQKL